LTSGGAVNRTTEHEEAPSSRRAGGGKLDGMKWIRLAWRHVVDRPLA
jgi:hypothetical protein